MRRAEFRLRPAEGRDAAAIRGLIRAAAINPTGLDWRRFVVAVDRHDAVIGCGQTRPHRDGSLELASIAVDEGWRRRGVARAVIRWLQAAAGPPLWLTCRGSLTALYERFGFRVPGAGEPQSPSIRRRRALLRMLARLTGHELAVLIWRREARGR